MVDETLLNTTTAGDQHQPGVAGLRGTQFIVVWADQPSGDIKGVMLGADGLPHGNTEFRVNFTGAVGTKRQLPAVIETGRGLAVAWIEQLPGGAPQVKLRTLDQDTLAGPESQVSSAEVEPLIRPAMAVTSDGGFVVVWADKRADERMRGQRYDFEGERTGAEFRASTVPGLHRVPMVASLTSGNIVTGWRARLPGPLLVHLQLFDAAGAPVGAEQTTALDITEAAMAPLDTGGFVIAHVRSALDGEPGFETTVAQISVFDANGTFTGTRFPATSAARIQSSWPTLAPLPGGRFVLAWTQVDVDNPGAGTNVQARVFSATGPVGQPVQVNTQTGGSRFSLAASTTAGPSGNTAMMAWVDDSAGGPDGSGRGIKGRALTVPAGGF
jgi:hypothetical protein